MSCARLILSCAAASIQRVVSNAVAAPMGVVMNGLRLICTAGLLFSFLWSHTARAAACSELVLGSVLSLTGRFSTEGVHTRNGYEFAIRSIKAGGGQQIGSKCYDFRVIYYDDESRRERGAQLARQLIEKDRVRLLLGPNSAAVADAVAAVSEFHKIPMISAQGTGKSLYRRGHRYHFGMLTAPQDYLAQTLDLAAKVGVNTGRIKSELKVAIALADGPYLDDVRTGLRARAAQLGLKVSLDESLPGDLADFGTVLAKVKNTAPDILVIAAHAKGAGTFVRQLAELQLQVPMIALSHCEAADIVTRNDVAANNLLCPSRRIEALANASSIYARPAAFAEAFAAMFKEYEGKSVPDEATQAAMAVHVLANAYHRAGTIDTEQVRKALAGTDLTTFLGSVKFSPSGENAVQRMVLRQIQDGKYRVVAPSADATYNLQWPRAGL